MPEDSPNPISPVLNDALRYANRGFWLAWGLGIIIVVFLFLLGDPVTSINKWKFDLIVPIPFYLLGELIVWISVKNSPLTRLTAWGFRAGSLMLFVIWGTFLLLSK